MIRQATPFDTEQIIEMLQRYKTATPLTCLSTATDTNARRIIAEILAGRGVIFVSEYDGDLIGMIIGLKSPNLWSNDVYCINELAYWVDPEYRHGSSGYRLLDAYKEYCDQQKQLNNIQYYTISKMSNSPDLKYDRFGFTKLEETWSQ